MLSRLWFDDRGFVVSSEIVLLGTLGVLGATVGLHVATTAVNEELIEVGHAFRSLDQSYYVAGFAYRGAATAGAAYQQQDVERSLEELRALEQRLAPAEVPRSEEDAQPRPEDPEGRPRLRPGRRRERDHNRPQRL